MLFSRRKTRKTIDRQTANPQAETSVTAPLLFGGWLVVLVVLKEIIAAWMGK